MTLYGGIEAGGTKFVCAVGTGPDDIRREVRFATGTPEECIGASLAFFRDAEAALGPLAAVGIASFGPIDPDPSSPTYGYVTTTPKPGWAHTNFAGQIREALGVPVGFDTDVNVAALGEYRWGAAQGLNTFIYLTVGTGIGGGAMVNGRLVHGLMHPEMGHIRIPHDRTRDPYPGICSYHGDCFEGLACGPAIAERWSTSPADLPSDHPAWDLETEYLANGIVSLLLPMSPQRIVVGGGVMEQNHLFPRVRRRVQELLNGYLQSSMVGERIAEYIVPPALGNRSGVLGGIALAELAAAGQLI